LGRLKAIEENVPGCGVLKTGAVAEYEVLKVFAGSYPGKEIFVVHSCIEMQRPKLSTGNVYKFSTTKENIDRIEYFSKGRIPKNSTTYFSKEIELQKNK